MAPVIAIAIPRRKCVGVEREELDMGVLSFLARGC